MSTLVIHGKLDPLARPEHGKAIADAVADAGCIMVPEWGHGLDYPQLWPELAKYLSQFCRLHP
jgi:hypothetical protein